MVNKQNTNRVHIPGIVLYIKVFGFIITPTDTVNNIIITPTDTVKNILNTLFTINFTQTRRVITVFTHHVMEILNNVVLNNNV